MRRTLPALASVGTGVLLAAALPPWGWWPLALVGLVALDRLIADRPRWSRFRRGFGTGVGLYLPSLAWMQDMTLPGYLIAVLAYAALLGLAATIVPAAAPGRWLALPGAVALTELLRWSWPFGGVPLSSLAVGQVAGPLAPVLRIGGALLLVEITVVAGLALSALLARRRLAVGLAAAVVVVAVAAGMVAPRGEQVGTLDLALVQGGGPQGTRASDTDEREVFERHLEASRTIDGDVDLVVWPEDVVDVEGPVGETREGRELAAHARELDAVLVAGVVEGVDRERFRNYSLALDADGEVVDEYHKVHRVPFGEYVPMRSLLGSLADAASGRDAVVGTGPAVLETPAADLSVAISWEIFFADRVREGVGDGAPLVINPTNGSSFTGTLVQTQQIATSRMRAIENGRWLAQVSPTGFSAVISPDGTVVERTGVSERAVLRETVGLRDGATPYTYLGLLPALVVAAAGLVLGWLVDRRSRRDLPPGTEPGAGDGPQTSRTRVTGPSLTSSTAMSAPKRPVATDAPADRSSTTTASTSGSA